MAGGRPTTYTKEIADRICELTATIPRGLQYICNTHEDLPACSTIRLWAWKHPEFSAQYLDAKRMQAMVLAEETIELAKTRNTYIDKDGQQKVDPGAVAANRLEINNAHWHASRLALPYRDKQDEDVKQNTDEMKETLKEIRANLDERNKKDY